ncbi:hypothetical protein [Blastococcus sp. SYSU D00820]
MSDDIRITVDADEYVLRRQGDTVQIGRQVGGEVTWLDDLDPSVLPDEARSALAAGDTSNDALLTALRGVVTAEVERGG